MFKPRISIIAVISANARALGNKGGLLWHIPGDLPRFKALTMDHPIIMGRKTYESIGKVLFGRTNIVISRNPDFSVLGGKDSKSFDEALEIALKSEGNEEIFVIGGGEIYKLAMPFASKLYLTIVDDEPIADTFFPEYKIDFKIIETKNEQPANASHPSFHYEILERKII